MRTSSLRLSVVLLAIGGIAACGGSTSDGTGETGTSSSSCIYNESGDAAKEAEVPPAEPLSADSLTR